MADKTYKLNITKSDGSFNDSVQFTIPQREGTYKVEFELSNGKRSMQVISLFQTLQRRIRQNFSCQTVIQ